MSWIKEHPFSALVVLALALRVGCATVTEFNPIFPSYYYTDAATIHSYAVEALADVRAGRPPVINGTLGERLQTAISLESYRLFGARPFVIKLFNALLGALAVGAFSWALSRVFDQRTAAAAGLLMAVWPSHVFYTSQNLKESPTAFLAYAALGLALAAGFEASSSLRRTAALSLAAALALLGAGFYRSYVMASIGAVLLAALALASLAASRRNSLTAAAAVAAALGVYPSASRALLNSFHATALSEADKGRTQSHLIPVTFDNSDGQKIYRPTSPEGISRFRSSRQQADRKWAASRMDREIGTQIYPEQEFRSWLDVALYIPKGAFTALFMPLPGLYPMEGKLGRWASAGENVILLLLAVLGLLGAARGPKTPARLVPLGFFLAMTAGAALLEFDLGSAGRHKLLYLPMLFPFAAERMLRLERE